VAIHCGRPDVRSIPEVRRPMGFLLVTWGLRYHKELRKRA